VTALLDRLSQWLHLLGVFICLPLLTLLVFVDVGLRYFVKAPIHGSNEIAGVLLLLVLLFSLPFTTAEDRHIKVDLCYNLLGPIPRRIADLVTALAGGVVATALAWHSFHTIPNELRYREATLLLEIPLWPLSLTTGLVAAYLALLFAAKGAKALFGGRR
jgi:TRAP-type C4-dicarboxylate transport system permease small subunit